MQPPPDMSSVIRHALNPVPTNLAQWIEALRTVEIPVLSYTVRRIQRAADDEDSVDVNTLADIVSDDPLMTIRLLRDVAHLPHGRFHSTPQTASEAVMLMGITPFLRNYTVLPTVQDRLADLPEALAGLTSVVVRAYRAARFAIAFASQRDDPDSAVLHEVALVHDFGEMLLWLHAPVQALQVLQLKASRPGLRSHDAQLEVLGIDLVDLRQALMLAWRLPETLLRAADTQHARSAKARTIDLAVRLARHTVADWHHPALREDVRDTAALLNLGLEPTRRLLPTLA